MSHSAQSVRPASWALATLYVGGSVLLGSGLWLTASVLPGTAQALAYAVAVPLVLLWLSIAGVLITMGIASPDHPRIPVPVQRRTRIHLPVGIRFTPQTPVRR